MSTEHADSTASAELGEQNQGVHLGSYREDPPALDFSGFILSLAQTVMIELGEAPLPDGSYQNPDLGMAQQTIDIVAMLREKTRGNLTEDEDELIEHSLYQLRMNFCEVKKARIARG